MLGHQALVFEKFEPVNFFYFQVWGKLTKTRLRLERHTLFRQHAVFIILKCELLAKDAMGEL